MNKFEIPSGMIGGDDAKNRMHRYAELIKQGYSADEANKEIGFEINPATGEYIRPDLIERENEILSAESITKQGEFDEIAKKSIKPKE